MKYSKIFSRTLLLLIFILSLNMTVMPVCAQELILPDVQDSIVGETTISPRGEVTGYIYKYINGRKYKRLWSYTGGYWVDPYWTPAE